jgi:iron(III) transport system ATP-binding protein
MLEVTALSKSLGGKSAVNRVTLRAETGEFVSLLGPSGCGKTTTLRMIAGLLSPDEGEITIGDATMYSSALGVDVPAEKRNVGMVFQSYAIWPHCTVFDNVAYPLKLRRTPGIEVRERVDAVLGLVDLHKLRDRFPGELSGGQQQRVALARALVYSPRVLLLDEPLANLDARVRDSVRIEIRALQRKAGITTVYVTHDQGEAMVLSDRVVVMQEGRVAQEDTPSGIYRRPASPFVAAFVGNSNLLPGKVDRIEGEHCVFRLDDALELVSCDASNQWSVGEPATLAIRPEDFTLHHLKPALRPNLWRVKVLDALYLGNLVFYTVGLGTKTLQVQADPHFEMSRGGPDIYLSLEAERVRAFRAQASLQTA